MDYKYTTKIFINGELEKEMKLDSEYITKLKYYLGKLEKQQEEKENTQEQYEGIFILKTTLSERALENVIEELSNKIGKCSKIENLGLKKLAYEIKGHTQGHYILFDFSATTPHYFDIEKYSRENENIIKFILVKRS